MPHVLKVPPTCPSCQQFSLVSPFAAPTSTDTPSMTTEAPCGEGWAPDNPMDTPEHLNLLGPHLGSSLLGAKLLDEWGEGTGHLGGIGGGNLLAPSPLLQNQPLLLPTLPLLGVSLGTASPMSGLLQSLQLGPSFGSSEKSATPLGPSAGGSPSPPAPPSLPEGTPSALEPPVPRQVEPGSSRPSGLQTPVAGA
ncbi:methyl-CpG-binding domain protein 6 [Haliaeetus albicilla]|uniref:methyl-CpG-binding domain protein 6 n=1 Tax=Haliaeetus albicilla TaxID=8969 RepID=UPI0037E8AA30